MDSTEHGLFHGSRLKIKRADQLIRELDDKLKALGKADHYRVWVENDPNTDQSVVRFKITGKVSDEVSPIIGDVIHNLRAALDLAACELVRWAGKTPTEHTKFPFRQTRQQVIAAIEGGAIEGLSDDFKTLIIDIIEPYKGGNNPLCALHALDIADKHQTLIQTCIVACLIVETMAEDGPVDYVAYSTQSGDVGEVRIPRNAKFEGYDEPLLHVSFDRDEVFRGRSILLALRDLSFVVAEIIEEFAGDCLTHRKEWLPHAGRGGFLTLRARLPS